MIAAAWDPSLLAEVPAGILVTVLLLGALFSLDETSLAQTWLGQPLPAAVIAGVAMGNPAVGLAVGLPFQLATLGNLPVGRSFLGDQAGPLPGVLGAVIVAEFLDGATRTPTLVPGELTARVGWLLVLLALASLVGHRVVKMERAWHVRLSSGTLRGLRDGGTGHLDRVQLRCLLATALRGAATAAVLLSVALLLWIPAFDLLAPRLHKALSLLTWCTPALALGALFDLYGSRAGRRWLVGAFVAVLALLWMVAWRGGIA